MSFLEKTRDTLECRPWLPAAVYLVLYGLFVVTIFVAGSNMVSGQFRLWEELDKADLAIVARISGAIARVMVGYAMLLAVVPLLFLMRRGVRYAALRVWGYGVGAILALLLNFLGVPVLPFALGMFIPLHLNMPLLIGGLVSWFVSSRSKDADVNNARMERGTLIASGFIAGGALMGVVAAGIKFAGADLYMTEWASSASAEILGVVMYIALIAYLVAASLKAKK